VVKCNDLNVKEGGTHSYHCILKGKVDPHMAIWTAAATWREIQFFLYQKKGQGRCRPASCSNLLPASMWWWPLEPGDDVIQKVTGKRSRIAIKNIRKTNEVDTTGSNKAGNVRIM